MKNENFHIHNSFIQSNEFNANSLTDNLNFDAINPAINKSSAGCNLIFGYGQYRCAGYLVPNSVKDDNDIQLHKIYFILCSNRLTDFKDKNSIVYSDLIDYADKFNYTIHFENVYSVNNAINANNITDSENYDSTKLIN